MIMLLNISHREERAKPNLKPNLLEAEIVEMVEEEEQSMSMEEEELLKSMEEEEDGGSGGNVEGIHEPHPLPP